MKPPIDLTRRSLFTRGLGAATALALAGCDRLSRTEWVPRLLETGEAVNRTLHKAFFRKAMAQEFAETDISPSFRSNGTAEPNSEAYAALAKGNFADWRLRVDGLVEKPLALSMADLRALPARTQITRHDCVEGWSAIAKWSGARMAALLEQAQPKPNARYLVFHCADPMDDAGTTPYYESIDMEDAFHVQTILAYELNGAPLPVGNGAPVRLRVERQLGYKQAKYIMRIELVEDFAHLHGGKGGYWEDNGYDWYAGI